MNTRDAYDDGRSNYSFNFSDNDGKHINVSFRAEPDWDLNVVFQEFRNFLIASGHDVENDIGEIHAYDESDEDDDEPTVFAWTHEDGPMERTQFEPKNRLMQNQTQDKFTMDHFPNNGWPFGGLTTAALPSLTSVDLSALSSQSFNQFPTMSPFTTAQVQVWSLPSMEIQALTSADLSKWRVDAPGTIGGAKVTF
jgi:hypothetical protein